jgi:hypothetical protein
MWFIMGLVNAELAPWKIVRIVRLRSESQSADSSTIKPVQKSDRVA